MWGKLGLVLAGLLAAGWLLDMLRRRRHELSLSEELETKDDFASYVAHELRTPMTVIEANSRLLDEGSLTPEERDRSVGAIRAATGRLHAVVETLLSLADIEHHSRGIESEPVMLHHLLKKVVDQHHQLFPGRVVDIDLPPGVPVVMGHETAIELVMTNLLSNAEKYGSPDQAVRVELAVRSTHTWVSVCNEGRRLDPQELQRVFERYERGTHHTELPGLGLGLALSQRLIGAMGGQMRASIMPEGGARFSFSLQHAANDAAASA